jgi:pentatricopeptide repeat protein
MSVKNRRSTSHSKHPHSVEGATTDARDAIASDIDNLAAELSGILTSTFAIANPFAALERALSHHREHMSGSSVHTYNTLLAYAARIGNYHGMRKILRDMQKGNVQWNEETRMIVTKATMRGPGGGAVRGERREMRNSSAKGESDGRESRQAGHVTGGVDSLPGLMRRVEAPGTSMSDAERRIALNAGYWKSETPPRRSQDAEGNPSTGNGSDRSRSPSSRISSLQGALVPAEARSHLPPLDEQLSPTLFLAFLRYILACNPQPPSLADSYTALIALDRTERMITSAHLRHLAHLYLHPSLYASFRPFWVIREMQRLAKDSSIAFAPTSETLEKALLSLRQRRNRHRRAVELVDYFRRKWGEEIIDISCWRLLGRYALEGKDKEIQTFAIEGGNGALARQIERSKAPGFSERTSGDLSINTPALAEEVFPQHGLDRRKWGRVRQAIVRHQSRARRAAAVSEASPTPTTDE